jgi:ferritin-like metal-binding protein YciE
MKALLNNLNEALTYHLEALHDAEKKIQSTLPKLLARTTTPSLKKLLQDYVSEAGDKRTKLKRAFSYLLAGPFKRKNEVMGQLISDLRTSQELSAKEIKDTMVAGGLKGVVQYKISCYSMAISVALQLELHSVADLLEEVLEWEKEAEAALIKAIPKIIAGASKKG